MSKPSAVALPDSPECGCGTTALLQRDVLQRSHWGDNPEVEFRGDYWHCENCGEDFFDLEQSQRRTIALLRATVTELRRLLSGSSRGEE